MNKRIAGRFRRCARVLRGSLGLMFVVAALWSANPAGAADALPGRVGQLAALGKKFDPAITCAKCHAEKTAKDAPSPLMTENATWNSSADKHSTAFTVLSAPRADDVKKHPELATIGPKMGIAKNRVDRDPQCLACHAMNAPKELRAPTFTLREGVSCNACHGPSGDWDGPHANAGWTNGQRTAAAAAAPKTPEEWPGQNAHAQLLKTTGLYDTKVLVARAEICVSCHLAIDPKMVEAGHPQPFFELDHFTFMQPRHWRPRAEEEGLGHARTWAVGQVVCMRDAMQELAKRAKPGAAPKALQDALSQALAHYSMVKMLVDAKAIDAGTASLDKGAVLKAALAAPAGKEKDIEAAATALAGEFKNLAGPAAAMKPDAAVTTKLLQAVAADASLSKDLAAQGAKQQSLAIWSLYNATAGESGPANAKIKTLVESVDSYGGKFDAAAYGTALTAVQSALPK